VFGIPCDKLAVTNNEVTQDEPVLTSDDNEV
jgi:hypothetical protein